MGRLRDGARHLLETGSERRPLSQQQQNRDTVARTCGVRRRAMDSATAARAPKGESGAPTAMIPPQVHLRRPCYDFYFL